MEIVLGNIYLINKYDIMGALLYLLKVILFKAGVTNTVRKNYWCNFSTETQLFYFCLPFQVCRINIEFMYS